MAVNMQDNTFDNCDCVCSKIDNICLALASDQNDTCFPHAVPSDAVAESFGTSQCNCCKCLKCPISVIKRLCQLAMRDDEKQYTANERYSVFEGGLSMSMDKKPQLDGRGDFAYIKKSKKLDYSSDERRLKPRRSSTKGKSKQVKGSDTDSDFNQENRKRRRRSKLDKKPQAKAVQNETKSKSYTASKVKKHGSAQKPFFGSSSSSNVAFKTNRISAKRRKRVKKSGSELDSGRATTAESRKPTKESRKAGGKETERHEIAQARIQGRNKSSNEVNRKLKKKKQTSNLELQDSTLTTQIGTEVLKEVIPLDKLTKSRNENKIRKMEKAFDAESFRWNISEIDEKTDDGNDDEAKETNNPPLWVKLKETKQDQKQKEATEELELSKVKVKVKGGEKSGAWPQAKAETKKHRADITKKKKKAEKERVWPVVEPHIGMIKEMNKRISRGMYATMLSNEMFGGRAQSKSSDTFGQKLKILNRLTPNYLKWERIEQSTDYEKNRQKRLSEKQPRIRKFNDADDNYKKVATRRPRRAKHGQKSTRVEQMGISDFMRAKLEAGDMRRLRTMSQRTVQKNRSAEFHPSLSTPSAANHASEFGDVSNPYPAAINPLAYCFM